MNTCIIEKLGEKIPLVAMLINMMPQSYTKKLIYKIVYGMKLKLPTDVVWWLLQSTCMPAVVDYT